MTPTQPQILLGEYEARLRRPKGDGGERRRPPIVKRSFQHACAHRHERLVLLRASGGHRAAFGRTDLVGPRPGCEWREADCYLDQTRISSAIPDHYVQSTERHPMDYLSGISPIAALVRSSIGCRNGQLLVLGAAFASLQKHLPNARFSDATALVNCRWSRARPRSNTGATRRGSSKPCISGIFDKIEVGMRKCDWCGNLRCGYARPSTASAATIRRSFRFFLRTSRHQRRISPGTTADEAGEGTFFEIAGC